MNIQKVFDAVEEDDINSLIFSIFYELEKQGYSIKL